MVCTPSGNYSSQAAYQLQPQFLRHWLCLLSALRVWPGGAARKASEQHQRWERFGVAVRTRRSERNDARPQAHRPTKAARIEGFDGRLLGSPPLRCRSAEAPDTLHWQSLEARSRQPFATVSAGERPRPATCESAMQQRPDRRTIPSILVGRNPPGGHQGHASTAASRNGSRRPLHLPEMRCAGRPQPGRTLPGRAMPEMRSQDAP